METFLSSYISNGNIDIPSTEFQSLSQKYTQEEIKEAFATEVLQNHSIEVPTKIITEKEAEEDFKNLCAYQTTGIHAGKTCSRYEYNIPMDSAYFWESTVGLSSSDYFHQTARYNAASQSQMSPCAVWQNERALKGALSPIWTLGINEITRKSLRSCIAMRKYIASQFRPAVAKSIYEYFNAESVLDFSAGWGDRLAGFYSAKCTKHYIGVDPNPAVFKNYSKQAAFYGNIAGSQKDCEFFQMPAEDMNYKKDSVDLVFTSPPYYIAERYTYGIKDTTQSSIRYKKLDEWLSSFLFCSIAKAWEALHGGGFLAINISNIYAKNKGNYHADICNPMHDFIMNNLNADFVSLMGIKMQRRPNQHSIYSKNALNDSVFCEPLWVYRKG